MDDRGGTLMNVDRLYRNLLNKLINANIDLDAYLQLRKAKGYMSVSEMSICVITCSNCVVKCVRTGCSCSTFLHRKKRTLSVLQVEPSRLRRFA